MPFERTFAEVLNAHKEAVKDDIRKHLPATVTAVDPLLQTVDVQIAVQNPLFSQYGNVSFEDPISIKGVRLAMLRAGKFFIWVPVAVGDSVWLAFSDLSLDSWFESVPGSKPVQPNWVGKHTADSPIAFPMVAPDASAFATIEANADKIIIGNDLGTQVTIDETGTVEVTATTAINLVAPVAALPGVSTFGIPGTAKALAFGDWAAAVQAALITFATGLNPTTVAANGAALLTALGALPPAQTTLMKGQ